MSIDSGQIFLKTHRNLLKSENIALFSKNPPEYIFVELYYRNFINFFLDINI